jgi:hypothetical protein
MAPAGFTAFTSSRVQTASKLPRRPWRSSHGVTHVLVLLEATAIFSGLVDELVDLGRHRVHRPRRRMEHPVAVLEDGSDHRSRTASAPSMVRNISPASRSG